MVPRKQAGHMTCTRPQAERQILLATRASSTHDPERTSATSRNPAASEIDGARAHARKKTREEVSASTTRDDPYQEGRRLERAKQSRDNNHAEWHAKKPKNNRHITLL
jgi:hypothetical protein